MAGEHEKEVPTFRNSFEANEEKIQELESEPFLDVIFVARLATLMHDHRSSYFL